MITKQHEARQKYTTPLQSQVCSYKTYIVV